MSIKYINKLPEPADIIERYPLSEKGKALKSERDDITKKIFTGETNKFIFIIGPCSADNEDSVMDYLERLRPLQEKVKDKIHIIPRIYTNRYI